MITIIAAVARNRALGFENRLLYWLPADMKRFRLLTTGHTIIMGRRTYDSLPNGALPNRRNIVLSRTTRELPGCECFTSLSAALQHCDSNEEIYVIGGASVYRQAMPLADRLCMTEVDDVPNNADVFFPSYDEGWLEVSREEHDTAEKHQYRFAFVDYVKEK